MPAGIQSGRPVRTGGRHRPGSAGTGRGPERRTYAELDEAANRFAHHLLDQGAQPGEFVGILAHNRAEWVEAMIGCYKARTVPINLNYRYVAPELRYVVDNADLDVARLRARPVAELAGRGHSRPIGGDGPHDWSRSTDGPGPVGSARSTTVSYEAALGSASPDRGFGPRSPDDVYVLYTGGTTGMPKGVVWRQEDIFFAAMGGGGWGAPPIARARRTGRPAQHRREPPGGHAGGGARSCTATRSG